MDKQKEIQKMQQEIFDSCAWRFSRHPEDYREVANDIGEDLYNLGYRNCKDKVVLTREAYKQLLDNAIRVDMEYLDHELANARKETAEKIFNALIGYTMEEDGWTWCISAENIQELARQYDVEIGEYETLYNE